MQFLALYAPYFLFISCILQIYYPAKARPVFELFYVTSMGQINNVVYGLVQCRGDLSKIDCQACANKTATEIGQLCFSQKEASVGYINCSLQFSDRRFFSTFDSFPRVNLHDVQTATDPNVSTKAASDPSKFAIGVTSYKDFNDIHGMTQAVRYLRYEIYSFFQSPLQHPPPAAASSPLPSLLEPNSSTTSGTNKTSPGKKKISKTIIIIVIPLLVGVCDTHKLRLLFAVEKDQAKWIATGNFSYKLGEGGFGPVYKVSQINMVIPSQFRQNFFYVLMWHITRSHKSIKYSYMNLKYLNNKKQFLFLILGTICDKNLLEIIIGRKNSSFCTFSNLQSYGTSLELLDPSVGDWWPRYEVLKCIHIGLLRVQEALVERPTMSEVVMMLNSYTTN
ncbi:cysteine-rich receptor-like protein kinase 10 [Pyrus ussuriensis x Pyrus communis]|uniref:Cysteine-rich receptor-like protein kinase 10 n=1 Tax=Pyrus ussuriensis x Pyrus communis TaxID=2448454 RepID=A0A5N5IG26_9ROSA|nr:cysteine-rich receptor-like protein kinase 10 [Pyrus ussuriensis x Pyrus communis]